MTEKILVIVAVIVSMVAMGTVAPADVPQLISFQGKLYDNAGNPVTGQRSITFRIYAVESGGTSVWSETKSVACDSGLYNVILGQTTAITLGFDGQYWLGVQVTGDSELSPRYRLVSVPTAFRAQVADEVSWTNLTDVPAGFADGTDDVGAAGGVSQINAGTGMTVTNPTGPTATVAANIGSGAAQVAAGNHDHDTRYYTETELKTDDGNAPNAGLNMVHWDNLWGVPAGFADGTDDVGGGGGGITQINGGTGILVTNPTGPTTTVSVNIGGGADQIAAGNHAHFSLNAPDGTPTNAVSVDTAGNVGIGTTSPTAKLHVSSGGIRTDAGHGLTLLHENDYGTDISSNGNDLWLYNYASGNIRLGTGTSPGSSTLRMIIEDNGNVGLGTTDPTEKLEVSGTAQVLGFKMPTGAMNGYVLTSNNAGVGTWQQVSGSGGLDGNGIDNYLSRWNGAGALESSVVYQTDDGKVGIGTTTPSVALEVQGDIQINSAYRIESNTVLSISGTENTLVGAGAGVNNTGSNVTFLGYNAGRNNQSSFNTFIGDNAGYSNSSGSSNTFLGQSSGYGNSSGSFNTFLGEDAGRSNLEGQQNTCVGENSGHMNTSGNGNVLLGTEAGYSVSGSGNVCIGKSAGYNETGSNKLYIDNSNTASPLIYGEFENDIVAVNGKLGIGTKTPGAELVVSSSGEPDIWITRPSASYASVLEFRTGENRDWGMFTPSGGSDLFLQRGTGSSGNLIVSGDGCKIGIGTSAPTHALTIQSTAASMLRLIGPYGSYGHGARFNFGDGENVYIEENADDCLYLKGNQKISLMGGKIGVGIESPNGILEVSHNNVSHDLVVHSTSGRVGIGTIVPESELHVLGTISSGETEGHILGSMGAVVGDQAGYIGTSHWNGHPLTVLATPMGYSDRGYVGACIEGVAKAGVYVNQLGQGVVFGDIMNFPVSNPNQPGTDICYACPEGPEAAAYVRGTGHLVNGRATVNLPDHFVAVASAQGITAQLTPLSVESRGLAVVEKSADRLVIRELQKGTGTYDFDYHVMAVRKGHEEYEVIRSAQPARYEAAKKASADMAPEIKDQRPLKSETE